MTKKRFAAYNLIVDIDENQTTFFKQGKNGLDEIVTIKTLPSLQKYLRKGNCTITNREVVGQALERNMNVPELQEYL